jgi:hypothetical protein
MTATGIHGAMPAGTAKSLISILTGASGGEMTLTHIPEIFFDSLGETLRMTVKVTAANPCTYEITSHDSHGVFQGTVMKGNNLNGSHDVFNIPTHIDELDQRVVGWHFIFSTRDENRNPCPAAVINFYQGDMELLPTPIALTGDPSKTDVVIGFARFINSRPQ